MKVVFVYMNHECNVGRGAGYVAGALLRAGHTVLFYDTLFTSVEAVAEDTIAQKPDALMISSMTMLFPEAVRLARIIKDQCRVPVLLGGIHATIKGGIILREYPEFDYLCIGEGETLAVEFLNHLGKETLFTLPNLAFRRDGKVVENPVRDAEDLSISPPFPWHLFDRRSVVQEEQGFLYVNATRGCPFNCSYCCNGLYLGLYGKAYLRYRPVEQVIEELKMLRAEYAPDLFYFGDEMILFDKTYTRELFAAMRNDLGAPYGIMARVEYLTPESVEILAKTGCQYIGVGVECGDESFRRKYLYRTMTNDQIRRAFVRVKKAGIFITSFNMIGYPFEFDDLLTEATEVLNEQIKPDYVQVSVFFPFPGTKLYERCASLDLVDHDKLANTREYFDESVLKDVSVKSKKDELHAKFNPHGFKFQIRRPVFPHKASILMISTDHLIIDRRILQQAKTLARNGYRVTVISGLECPHEEHVVQDGIELHRYSYQGEGEVRGKKTPSIYYRLPAYLQPLALKAWNLFTRKDPTDTPFYNWCREIVSRFPADIVHVHDLNMLWLGVEAAAQWDSKLVYDSHEIYYENNFLPQDSKRLLMQQEKLFVPKTDLFITVNDAIADYFGEKYGKVPLVLHNCTESPSEDVLNRTKSRLALRQLAGIDHDSRVVLYQGWFSSERNLRNLVMSAGFLPANAYLVMIGYGDYGDELKAAISEQPWRDKVRFVGRVEPDQLMELTTGADVGVIPYLPVDLNHRLCSPNKFFEYVQSLVPVVSHDLQFFRKMADRYGVVSTGDLSTVEGMSRTINELLNNPRQHDLMRTACNKAAKELNWENESLRLVDAYSLLLPKTGPLTSD